MSNQIRWAQSDYDAYLRKFTGDNRAPVSVANSKSNIPDALDSTPKIVCMDQKFRVRITSYGRRLADTDGNSAKAVLDGFTEAGIWPDDSSKFIEEVSFTQKNAEKDQTVIEVWVL